LPFTDNLLYTLAPANITLDAAYICARHAHTRENPLQAIGLAEYGRYLLEHHCNIKPTNSQRWRDLYLLLGDLHESQGMYHLASSRLSGARTYALNHQEKAPIKARLAALRERRDEVSSEAHRIFIGQLESLLQDAEFSAYVIPELYTQMLHKLKTP
jgi:hypothetical protein